MGNLSGEFHEQNRKDKVTRFPSVTYVRQLGLLVNTLGNHLKRTGSRLSACSFVEMLSFCQDMLYRLCKQYDHVMTLSKTQSLLTVT